MSAADRLQAGSALPLRPSLTRLWPGQALPANPVLLVNPVPLASPDLPGPKAPPDPKVRSARKVSRDPPVPTQWPMGRKVKWGLLDPPAPRASPDLKVKLVPPGLMVLQVLMAPKGLKVKRGLLDPPELMVLQVPMVPMVPKALRVNPDPQGPRASPARRLLQPGVKSFPTNTAVRFHHSRAANVDTKIPGPWLRYFFGLKSSGDGKSDVEIGYVQGVFLYEFPARLHQIAHKLGKRQIGNIGFTNLHLKQGAHIRIEGGFP